MRPDRFEEIIDKLESLTEIYTLRANSFRANLSTKDSDTFSSFLRATQKLYQGLEWTTRRLKKIQTECEVENAKAYLKLDALAAMLIEAASHASDGDLLDGTTEDPGALSDGPSSIASSTDESDRSDRDDSWEDSARRARIAEETQFERAAGLAAADAAYVKKAAADKELHDEQLRQTQAEIALHIAEMASPREHAERLRALGATLKGWREKPTGSVKGAWKGKGRMSDVGPSTQTSLSSSLSTSASTSAANVSHPFIDPLLASSLSSTVASSISNSLSSTNAHASSSTSTSTAVNPQSQSNFGQNDSNNPSASSSSIATTSRLKNRPRLSAPLPQNPRLAALGANPLSISASSSPLLATSTNTSTHDPQSSIPAHPPLAPLPVEPSPFNPLANSSNKRRRYNEVEGGGKVGGFFDRLRKEGDGLENSSEEED